MKATLRITHEGKTREEVVDLAGSNTGQLMKSAMQYMADLNEKLPVSDRHVLLAVKPGEHVPASFHRSCGLPGLLPGASRSRRRR